MKKIIITLTLIFTSLWFNSCGGGGSGGASVTQIQITVACVTSPTLTDIDAYITLLSGDTIVKDEDNTTISTFHDIDGVKKVCLVSGSAHIVR